MKSNQYLLLALCLFLAGSLLAQKPEFSIQLKNGPVKTVSNINKTVIDSFNAKTVRSNNKSFLVVQFENIPTETIRKQLSSAGIEILEYIPNNAYTVTVSGNIQLAALQSANAKAIVELTPQQKMQSSLAEGRIPAWAVKVQGTVDVWISFPKTFTAEEVINDAKQLNAEVVSTKFQSFRILSLRIAANRLTELASYPFVEFM